MNLLYFTPLLALAATLLSSCSSTPYTTSGGINAPYLAAYRATAPSNPEPTNPNERTAYWDDTGITGAPLITLSLTEQKAYFYKGSQLVGYTPISTGSEGRRTPRGRYSVTERDIDHKSSLYGVIKDIATGQTIIADAKVGRNRPKAGQVFVHAPMNYFLRFNGAIGMHTGYLPGYPASHGCVRLPDHMARKFFENAPLGTPVIVQ